MSTMGAENRSSNGAKAAGRYPVRLLVIASLLTAATIAWLGWVILETGRAAKIARDQSTRMEELGGVILHFGEVLGGSVRLAVTTGASRWEARYRLFEPKLDAAINEVKTFATHASSARAAAQTDEANLRLVKMENRAFELVRAGRMDEARAVVFSSAYEKDEQIYAQGSALFIAQIRREVDERERQGQRVTFLSLLGATAVLAMTFAAWWSVLRSLRRWRAELEEAIREREQADQALRRAHAELEMRIRERTAELGKTNEALQTENTERKQAEESLRESERRYQSLAETSPAGVFQTDPDGQTTYVNARWCELAGLSVEEARGEGWLRAIHPEDREALVRGWREASKAQGISESDYRLMRRDGSVIWVIGRAMPDRDTAGRLVGYVGTITDITGRKQAELQLEQAHKQLLAVSRQAGMAEFATGILHNVGNALNSVNVASTCVADSLRKSKSANLTKVVALLREHEKDLGDFFTRDPKGRLVPEYLAQLAEQLASEQAGALKELAELQKNIEHIKDIVTSQQGMAKSSSAASAVNVTELVDDALKMNSTGVARHKIDVIKECADLPAVMVEKSRALQILVNLVRNAKQACAASGNPEKKLTIRTTAGIGQVRIAVTDNGVGIPPENLARIFTHSFTTKQDGHGFGLHSAALAAKDMGGALSVQSDGPGHGATFTLELPCDAGKANS